MNKIKSTILIGTMYLASTIHVEAATPKFNEAQAKSTLMEWLTPIMNIALWVIPVAAIARIGIAGISWLQKDEQEREQNPFHRTLINYIKWTVIIEMIPLIFTIFGLANSLG